MTAEGFVRTAWSRLADVADHYPDQYATVRNGLMIYARMTLDETVDIREIGDAIPDDVAQFRRATEPPGIIRIPGVTMHPLPLR